MTQPTQTQAPCSCPTGANCQRGAAPGVGVVTLLSGVQCCSWCPAWRAETLDRELEARRILKLPDVDTRRDALAKYQAIHGKAARDSLAAVITGIWERLRAP